MATRHRALVGSFGLIAAALFVTACTDPAPTELAEQSGPERPALGLMSSLPLYWPLGADVASLVSHDAKMPWARGVMEQDFVIEPLDTLSPIPSLAAGEPDSDPLEDLSYVAIIQPRGLSPSDNVALDEWVREGGSLLLALDPELTGHYEIALTDPRHPSVIALIPPVVKRWGLAIRFSEDQGDALHFAALGEQPLALHRHGEIAPEEGGQSECIIDASGALARCTVGKGHVTVVADAAVFEHEELGGENGEAIIALLDFAFGNTGS